MEGEGPPLPVQYRTVKLSTIVHRVVEKTYHELGYLTESLRDKPDQIRKLALRDFFQRARFRLLRLLVLLKWAKHVPTVKKCWEILEFLQEQATSLRDAADNLFWISNNLKGARTPNYDVPTAIDVLTTGSYQRMPASITNLVPPPPISTLEEEATIERLNDAINMRLFTAVIPPQFAIHVARGRAFCRVEDEFEIILTLTGEEKRFVREMDEKPLFPWRVLSLEVFIAAESDGETETTSSAIPAERILDLQELLQRRISGCAHPLVEIYTIMHAVCVPLQLDLLNAQAQTVAKKRPDLKVEYIPDKELKIYYWRTSNAQITRPASEPFPCVQIFVEDGNSLAVRHHPLLLEPDNLQPIPLTLCPTRLDVGSLLQQAISHHSRILLHRLYTSLLEQPLPCFSANHISLSQNSSQINEPGQAFLQIYLLESQSLSISIDLQTGRFVLFQSTMPQSEEAFLQTLEAKLNKDFSEIGSVITALVRRATLEHFCRLASTPSLGLEPFHHLMVASHAPPIKPKEEGESASESKEEAIPHAPMAPLRNFSEDTVYLCFKDAPDFYLAVELTDEEDFKPTFHMLVTRKDQGSKALLHIQHIIPLDSELPSSPRRLSHHPHQKELTIREKEKEKERDEQTPKRYVGHTEKSREGTPSSILLSHEIYPTLARNKRKFAELGLSKGGFASKRPKNGGNPSAQFRSVFIPLVLLCRKKIASLTIRRLFDESKGIEYKIEDNGEIQFSIPCDTVMNISGMRIRFLENFEWEVLVMESHPTFTFLEMMQHTPQNVNDHIGYEKGRGWSFSYKTVHTEGLKTFLRDLRGVSRMTILAKQLEEVLGPTSRFNHLQKYYSIQYFSPTYISLLFENQTRTLSILWTPEQNFVLSFGGFSFKNAHYFEFMLNTQRNMKELLEAVYCGHRPLQIISSFLHPIQALNHQESLFKSLEILPNEFTVIPRSPSQVRLIFSNICGVDIRFLPNQMVQIDDAAMALFHPSPSSTMGINRGRQQLYPLNHFGNFYTRHILPLVIDTSTLSGDSVPQGRVTHAAFPTALRLLHRFMGVLYFYRQAGPLLKAEMVDVKPEQHNNGIRFTINKMTFVICIVDYCHLELQWKENKEGDTLALFGEGEDTHSGSMSSSDISVLTEFFKQHVASPPYRYRINCLTSFIRILGLPSNVLLQFVHLMARGGKMQLCLLVPESNYLLAAESQNTPGPGSCAIWLQKSPPAVYFVLRYPVRSTWGHLGLIYQYGATGEPVLSLWATQTRTSEASALFSSVVATALKTPDPDMLSAVVNALEHLPEEELLKLSPY